MRKAYFNWSGGKDSSFALWKIMQQKEYSVDYLLTSINTHYNRVSMHGVRKELIEEQANSIGVPLTTIDLPEHPGMEEYEQAMSKKVGWLKENGCSCSVFGDIFLEDLKKYREEKLSSIGIECIFPIWQYNTTELLNEFVDAGFKSIIVCVNENYLDKSFCGRIIDRDFIKDLPPNIDPCGENGEYHSFCFAGPIFQHEIPFKKGEIVYRSYPAPGGGELGFHFCELINGE
jgi:uncharacterized protein (TIGR00290 family)